MPPILHRPTGVVEDGSFHREQGSPFADVEDARLIAGSGFGPDALVGDAQMDPCGPQGLVEARDLKVHAVWLAQYVGG